VTLLYNLVMLAVDVFAIVLIGRSRRLLVFCGVIAFVAAVAAVLGFVLGMRFENHFGVMRLWAYGVFLHGTAMLLATAVLWRRCHRWLALVAVLAALAVVAVAVDAFLIEPTWLEVSHWRIASAKIHKPLRIVVVADLQTDEIGPYQRRVFYQILDEKPDVVLFAGDYLQPSWQGPEGPRSELRRLLSEPAFRQLSSKRLFAVQGNTDPPDWFNIFEGLDLGVTLVPKTRSFDLGEIELTCLDISDSRDTSLVVANPAPGRFHLVLGHIPNFARGRVDADLLVAGHTHGGQVRLPWFGPILTLCNVPRAWAAGLTQLPGRPPEGGTTNGGGKLLVSRGIGLECGYAPRLRFLCRPELMVIDLVPEK
jgi:uncharacterized protein